MSNTGAGPMRGCASRLLPYGAAVACESIQPVDTFQHMPPPFLSSFDARPMDPRADYTIAIADRIVASTYQIPMEFAKPPQSYENLGAGTRAKPSQRA